MRTWPSRIRRILRNRLRPETRLRLWAAWRYREPSLLARRQADVERLHLQRRFREHFGTPLDLDDPRTFSGKIQWRKLYDRRPLFTRLVDKVEVRDYVTSRVGEGYLIPLLAIGSATDQIRFEDLEPPYIVKPTHASRMTARIRKRSELDRKILRREFDPVLADPYGVRSVEWAYWNVPGRIMVERLLLRADGTVPYDYKIHTFGGRARFVEVHMDRFGDYRASIFDTEWNLTDARYAGLASGGELQRPARLDEMIEVAESLAAGVDYLRVDLYMADDQIRVGELTVYPASGLGRFEDLKWERRWGEIWELPEGTRKS